MNKNIRFISLITFLFVFGSSFAQIGDLDKEQGELEKRISEVSQKLDDNAEAFSKMDSIAEELQAESGALDDKLKEAEQKIEAAQEKLNKDTERAEWAKYLKFGILALALAGIVFIFMKKRRK